MNGTITYKENEITTQIKSHLIIMLYDGVIKFLRLAIKELEQSNYNSKSNYIFKAKYLIDELNEVLDMEAGGEIAINLRKLYMFMNNRLSRADIQCDPQMIHEVISLIEKLNQRWKTICSG